MQLTPKRITRITYNWHQVNWDGSAGEDYNEYSIGQKSVTEIIEHPAIGEGDKWFYDVYFEDGHMERLFNPNIVVYQDLPKVEPGN